ncbi:MAG: ABC transporter substrate-binding protein [Pseudoxanthomonas sp.]
MSTTQAAPRRAGSIALIVLVLIAGIGGILYKRDADQSSGAATGSTAAAKPDGTDVPPLHTDKDPKAIALLPASFAYAAPGTLTVATHPALLPLGDYASDGKRIIGIEPDIAQLLADALGLKLNLVPVAWADWPLGLESGKYDAVISNVTVTEERKAKFDFSSYRFDLLGIYTRTEGPLKEITRPEQVAGLKVAVGAATNQDQILRRWDADNLKKGLKPVEFQYFEDSMIARLAVITGRADVSFEPNATGAFAARDGKVRRVGLFPGGWPQAAAISVTTRKGSGLADAITQALNTQIDNGNYSKALERWDLIEEAVQRSETNPPGLADL